MQSTIWTLAALASVVLLPGAGHAQRLDDFVDWMPDLVLEETENTYITGLALRADPLGGWITWDAQANQVRLYSSEGRLRGFFGRAGDGPGEFRGVASAVRITDGRLVAIDRRGRVSIWDPSGSELQADFRIEALRPFGMIAGEADTIIVALPPRSLAEGSPTKLLHRVSLNAEAIVGSFFDIPVSEDNIRLIGTIQSPAPTMTSAGIAVALSVLDSIWVTPLDGSSPALRIGVAARGLDGLRADRPLMEELPALREWIGENTFVGQVFQRADSGWLVQVWGFDGEPWGGVVALNSDHSVEWEVAHTLMLLWYDPGTDLAYFSEPNGLEPGRVRVGRLR